jgi:riboflavin synthase alpha subunit
MFTGIVDAKGTVAALTHNAFGARLVVDAQAFGYHPPPGDSIAINGVCLTHAPNAADPPRSLAFDVIRETLDRTNLGTLAAGDPVNLEASVRADTPLAGHFVQGHIDGCGTVVEVRDRADEWRTTSEAPAELMPCIVPKGSIAIDGVSLTIADADALARRFAVALIPTTLDRTTLIDRKAGDRVNLETDIIARTVVNYLQHHAAGADQRLSLRKLLDAGFD